MSCVTTSKQQFEGTGALSQNGYGDKGMQDQKAQTQTGGRREERWDAHADV